MIFTKPLCKLPDSAPPNKEELKEIINKLKNNKAAGKDSIVAELLKYAGDKIVEQLEKLFKQIWLTENIPQDWRDAIIHPLHKKEREQTLIITEEYHFYRSYIKYSLKHYRRE